MPKAITVGELITFLKTVPPHWPAKRVTSFFFDKLPGVVRRKKRVGVKKSTS